MIKTIPAILVFLCLIVNCYSQEIHLTKDDTKKKFNENSIFEIFSSDQKAATENCFNCSKLIGKIRSTEGDSIKLDLMEMRIVQTLENTTVEKLFSSDNFKTPISMSKEDILFVKNYKSNKRKKTKENLSALGNLLLFAGGVTMLSSVYVPDKKSKKHLLGTGGMEFGVGILLIFMARSKKYHLRNSKNLWKFN